MPSNTFFLSQHAFAEVAATMRSPSPLTIPLFFFECYHLFRMLRMLTLLTTFNFLVTPNIHISQLVFPQFHLSFEWIPCKRKVASLFIQSLTCVSVTFRRLASSALSLAERYFFTSNCFSSSKICRPLNVVLAFFFFSFASWLVTSSDGDFRFNRWWSEDTSEEPLSDEPDDGKDTK